MTLHSYISLLFFSFSRYGDHRDLHSFPTRRSSDLCGVTRLPAASPEPSSSEKAVESILTESTRNRFSMSRPFPDRKSTRLNSSHTVISYAVFCLKKKKLTRHNKEQRSQILQYPLSR